jgi:hypothetical protein
LLIDRLISHCKVWVWWEANPRLYCMMYQSVSKTCNQPPPTMWYYTKAVLTWHAKRMLWNGNLMICITTCQAKNASYQWNTWDTEVWMPHQGQTGLCTSSPAAHD